MLVGYIENPINEVNKGNREPIQMCKIFGRLLLIEMIPILNQPVLRVRRIE